MHHATNSNLAILFTGDEYFNKKYFITNQRVNSGKVVNEMQ